MFKKNDKLIQLLIYLCIMKNTIKILSAVVLIAIYCFAINTATKSINHSNFQHNSNSTQEKYFSDLSTKFFCHTSPPESLVENYNNQPNSSFKNPFNGLWVKIKTTEQLFKTTFSQYINFSINFLIQHRKTDIIFPFHYFW